MFCLLTSVYLALLHLTTSVEVDLSGSDWLVQSDIPPDQLSDILNLLNTHHRAEVKPNHRLQVNGTVPGYVLSDLHEAGVISDPLAKDHDVRFRPLARLTWVYSKAVWLPGVVQGRGLVVFHGIDTAADIVINKVHLFKSHYNQFRRLVIKVDELKILRGYLQISVVIQPGIAEAKTRAQMYPHLVPPVQYPAVQQGEKYRNFIRKSPASFSWDWGPAFIPSGVWKPVTVIYNQDLYVEEIGLRTRVVNEGIWNVEVEVRCISLVKLRKYPAVRFDIKHLDNGSHLSNETSSTSFSTVSSDVITLKLSVNVSGVEVWFPKNLGTQSLYELSLQICTASQCISTLRIFGFRTVILNQEPLGNPRDGGHKRFEFVVNDRPVYIKGANLVPLSVLENASFNLTTLFDLVEYAGINTLRVWGGGVYQSEKFYQEADRRGIMIWQEFMFACSLYPADDRFLTNVREEVVEQARRINAHPSVILFSGNNENKQGLQENWYKTNLNKSLYVSEYMKLYDNTIRDSVSDMIDVPYLMSSPSNGEDGGWVEDDPQSQLAGDIHFYDYFSNCLNTSNLPVPRFASEFGFQSFPSLQTLRKAFHSHKVELFDENTEHRQHLVNGNRLLYDQIDRMFQNLGEHVTSLSGETLVYLSQLNQALCVSSQISHFTRHYNRVLEDGRGMNTGVMFWQLNDVWAAPTWSAIDVDLRPKMLFYAVKHLYNPVVGNAHWNTTHMVFYVVNQLGRPVNFDFDLFLYDTSSTRSLYEWGVKGVAEPTSSTDVFSISKTSLQEHCRALHKCFVAVEFEVKSEGIRTVDVARPGFDWADLSLAPPSLTVEVVKKKEDRIVIKLKTMRIALWVWLEANQPGIFSHNFFPMYVPEMFLEFIPNQMSDQCCKIRVTSLYDHYYLAAKN